MKSSEGRHSHIFLQESEVEFGKHFTSNLVSFWSPGVLLGPFGGSPGPGPNLLMNIVMILDACGGVRGARGPPCGSHLAPL